MLSEPMTVITRHSWSGSAGSVTTIQDSLDDGGNDNVQRRSFLHKALGFTVLVISPLTVWETSKVLEPFPQEVYDELLTRTLILYKERLIQHMLQQSPLLFPPEATGVPNDYTS